MSSIAMDDVADAGACPDENALSELVQGLLEDDRAAALELHLDRCAECRRTVSSVGRSSYVAQRIRTRVDGEPTELIEASQATAVGDAQPGHDLPACGTVVAGKYRIERLLGQGGMGVVMAATHLPLGKLVALKLMRSDLAVDAAATQRFVREARAASLLRSEHIVRVLDLDTLDDGVRYIAMEYLEGEDLGALLARRGSLATETAATYLVQVCEAIAEAHAAGIVHRDLKPANLFLVVRGDAPCVKVLDFGVSKIIAGGPLADNLASTDTRALVGSPHYMAPEQLISAKLVDPRSDVWALGCILFELVSGKNPFAGRSLAQVLASILRDDVPSLDDLCPRLPAGFAAIVARCLDKDPARRYQRVDELAAALAPFVGGVARAEPSIEGPPMPLVTPAPQPAPTARRRLWPYAAIACAALGAAGIALVQLATVDTSREPPLPAAAVNAPAPPAIDSSIDMPVVHVIDAGTAAPFGTPDEPDAAAPRRHRRVRLEDDLIGPPR